MGNLLMALAMRLINSNPAIKSNPRYKEMIDVIQNGDNERGIEIARNLCATYGVSEEEAFNSARKHFGV